jgi:hypothetical protein
VSFTDGLGPVQELVHTGSTYRSRHARKSIRSSEDAGKANVVKDAMGIETVRELAGSMQEARYEFPRRPPLGSSVNRFCC